MQADVSSPPGISVAEDASESPPRGFAAMDVEKQRKIASMGGKAAHERGRAHKFTSEEAQRAGKKGGEAVSRDRDYMVAIGRRGGHARSTRLQSRQKKKASA